jgi:HAMP domain-containing protein/Tfp pilus assembly protein PilF
MKKNTSIPRTRPANGSRLNGDELDAKELLAALLAFKRGDFSARLPDDWTGVAGKVADTFNDVITINQRMTQELERIGRVVGKEGRITQRASLGDMSDSWAEAVASVNNLIGDLVRPTSEMARVIGAVAKGDLSKTMATEVEGRQLEGAFLRTAKIVNTMVDQLGTFASEVTRVAQEVGTEGKLGGQAKVKGVAGTWKDLTENVNLMAGNLTAQVRNIAKVTSAVAKGDLTKKITLDVKGEFLELKDTVNVMVDQLRSFASEVTRVAREVGSEDILGGQARVEGVSGTWKDLTDSVNFMARNLTGQVRNIAAVTTAVATEDLSKKITADVKGEILELKNTINTMVDQLSSFASEVTRVAREVGSEGKLGGQADVKGVAETWKDLTDSVNSMAGNLTGQVRNIAEVITAVANGDLSKKITVDVRGEILVSFFRRRLRPARLAIAVAASAAAILLGIASFSYGSKLYRDWHQRRLLHRAASMLQEEKFDQATQNARKVLTVDPNSVPAYYVLAEAAEKQNLEEAVSWRAQIARLLPKDPDSQLNLASAALRFGQIDLAQKALDAVAPDHRDSAAFHVVAGWLARAEGNLAEQEAQFAAAVKEEPGNDLYQFNLAALQIQSTDTEKSTKARDVLDRLSKVAPFRTGALRALFNDAVARNDLAAADNFAQQLQMSQEVTFGDYLLCLAFYRKLDEKKFRPLLERVKPFAVRSPSDLASLMSWMNENGLAGGVVKWIDTLSDTLSTDKLTSPPVSIAVADTYANTKNWSRLRRWTSTGSWGDSDYLRIAYQAIATRRSQSRNGGTAHTEFETLWRLAEQAVNEQPERELDLARLGSKWDLGKESEQLWLRVANNPSMGREALEALRRLYRANDNLEKLYGTLQRLHESSPNEAPITADLARLGLNIEQNTKEAHDLAKEAYDRAPNELNCAVTYAFSLDRLGRTAEGLEIITKLPTDQLHDPHVAVYVALLLLDSNRADAAKEYIDAASDGKIYAEEKKLLGEARTKLATALTGPTRSVAPASTKPNPTPTPTP